MPIDPRINMSYRGVELDNPIQNALSAEQLQARKMQNAMAAQEMEQMQSPEYKERQGQVQRIEREDEKRKFMTDRLGMVVDQPSLQAFNDEVLGIFGGEIPPQFQQYGDHIEKIKQGMGITKQSGQGAAAYSGTPFVAEDGGVMAFNKQTGQFEPTNQRMGLKPTQTQDYIEEQARRKATGSAEGKARGEDVVSFEDMSARLPMLQTMVGDLKTISSEMTSTSLGRGRDFLAREVGESTKGGVARAKYVSKVRNEILPLLRQTFGAAFTVAEGEKLESTLGNPNLSPAERDAELDSFIESKVAQVDMMRKKVGAPQQINQQPQQSAPPASDADSAAIQWAQQNPNDPRAQAIWERIKAKRGM